MAPAFSASYAASLKNGEIKFLSSFMQMFSGPSKTNGRYSSFTACFQLRRRTSPAANRFQMNMKKSEGGNVLISRTLKDFFFFY